MARKIGDKKVTSQSVLKRSQKGKKKKIDPFDPLTLKKGDSPREIERKLRLREGRKKKRIDPFDPLTLKKGDSPREIERKLRLREGPSKGTPIGRPASSSFAANLESRLRLPGAELIEGAGRIIKPEAEGSSLSEILSKPSEIAADDIVRGIIHGRDSVIRGIEEIGGSLQEAAEDTANSLFDNNPWKKKFDNLRAEIRSARKQQGLEKTSVKGGSKKESVAEKKNRLEKFGERVRTRGVAPARQALPTAQVTDEILRGIALDPEGSMLSIRRVPGGVGTSAGQDVPGKLVIDSLVGKTSVEGEGRQATLARRTIAQLLPGIQDDPTGEPRTKTLGGRAAQAQIRRPNVKDRVIKVGGSRLDKQAAVDLLVSLARNKRDILGRNVTEEAVNSQIRDLYTQIQDQGGITKKQYESAVKRHLSARAGRNLPAAIVGSVNDTLSPEIQLASRQPVENLYRSAPAPKSTKTPKLTAKEQRNLGFSRTAKPQASEAITSQFPEAVGPSPRPASFAEAIGARPATSFPEPIGPPVFVDESARAELGQLRPALRRFEAGEGTRRGLGINERRRLREQVRLAQEAGLPELEVSGTRPIRSVRDATPRTFAESIGASPATSFAEAIGPRPAGTTPDLSGLPEADPGSGAGRFANRLASVTRGPTGFAQRLRRAVTGQGARRLAGASLLGTGISLGAEALASSGPPTSPEGFQDISDDTLISLLQSSDPEDKLLGQAILREGYIAAERAGRIPEALPGGVELALDLSLLGTPLSGFARGIGATEGRTRIDPSRLEESAEQIVAGNILEEARSRIVPPGHPDFIGPVQPAAEDTITPEPDPLPGTDTSIDDINNLLAEIYLPSDEPFDLAIEAVDKRAENFQRAVDEQAAIEQQALNEAALTNLEQQAEEAAVFQQEQQAFQDRLGVETGDQFTPAATQFAADNAGFETFFGDLKGSSADDRALFAEEDRLRREEMKNSIEIMRAVAKDRGEQQLNQMKLNFLMSQYNRQEQHILDKDLAQFKSDLEGSSGGASDADKRRIAGLIEDASEMVTYAPTVDVSQFNDDQLAQARQLGLIDSEGNLRETQISISTEGTKASILDGFGYTPVESFKDNSSWLKNFIRVSEIGTEVNNGKILDTILDSPSTPNAGLEMLTLGIGYDEDLDLLTIGGQTVSLDQLREMEPYLSNALYTSTDGSANLSNEFLSSITQPVTSFVGRNVLGNF